MRLLFLDIDGVLNDHIAHENYYCGIGQEQARRLNRILREVPDLQIVISSSWRYMVLQGAMTLEGFMHLLSTHGVSAWGRVHGHTAEDHPEIPDHIDCRAHLINCYVAEHKPTRWVAVDDLPLPLEHFVRTNEEEGLTDEDVERVLKVLRDDGSPPTREREVSTEEIRHGGLHDAKTKALVRAKVMQIFSDSGSRRIVHSVMTKRHFKRFPARMVRDVLADLVDEGVLNACKVPTNGRYRMEYEANFNPMS